MEPDAIYRAELTKVVTTYPVLCSWCQRRGVRTVVNTSTIPNSHGICKPHQIDLLENLLDRRHPSR